jgi:hypothetical protein
MAIGTPVSLGTTADAAASDPYTLSTTAVVPSGALVVMCVFTGNSTTPPTATVTGGGLTWTEDKQQTGTNGTARFLYSIWSAPAPDGLASATTLNFDIGTGSGTTFSGLMSCFYIEGVSLQGDRANMTDGAFTAAGSSTWDSTSSATTVADTILIGQGIGDSGATFSSTPTGGASEIHDFTTTDNMGMTTTYRIVSATGTYGATGNWTPSSPADSSGASVCAYRSSDSDVVWPPGGTDNAPETIIDLSAARFR